MWIYIIYKILLFKFSFSRRSSIIFKRNKINSTLFHVQRFIDDSLVNLTLQIWSSQKPSLAYEKNSYTLSLFFHKE